MEAISKFTGTEDVEGGPQPAEAASGGADQHEAEQRVQHFTSVGKG
jgi:hypothetical protein